MAKNSIETQVAEIRTDVKWIKETMEKDRKNYVTKPESEALEKRIVTLEETHKWLIKRFVATTISVVVTAIIALIGIIIQLL